jgi:ABC-type transport system substrate-binding protein
LSALRNAWYPINPSPQSSSGSFTATQTRLGKGKPTRRKGNSNRPQEFFKGGRPVRSRRPHNYCPYNLKKAHQLLAQAGYLNGCDVQLYYSAGRYPKDREVCQAVAAQMVKGGFRVELVSQEWALFWGHDSVNGGKLPFYYNNRGSLSDADTIYDQYFRTGTTKRCNYSNPEFDKLINEEQKIPDIKPGFRSWNRDQERGANLP